MFTQRFGWKMPSFFVSAAAAGVMAGAGGLLTSPTAAQAGVVAYYSFDNSANLGADDSGNGINLQADTSPTAVTGQVGGAAHFDNSNGADGVLTHASGAIYPDTPNLSVSFWVKPEELADSVMMTAPASHGDGGLAFWFKGYSYILSSYTDAPKSTGYFNVDPEANTYVHLAFTFQAAGPGDANGVYTGTAKLYADGVLENTYSSFQYKAGSSTFGLGGRAINSSTDLTGDIDEFAVFDQTLTGAQVAALAAGDTPEQALAVPEPASLALLGLGGLTLLQRRRKAIA